MCPAHYQRQRKGAALTTPLRPRAKAPDDGACDIPGCIRPFLAKRLCRAHYYQDAGHRSRVRRGGGQIFTISTRDFRRLHAGPCMACGATEDLIFDHLIPVERGGDHSIGNLSRLCRPCNTSKLDQTYMEWRFSEKPRAILLFERRAS